MPRGATPGRNLGEEVTPGYVRARRVDRCVSKSPRDGPVDPTIRALNTTKCRL